MHGSIAAPRRCWEKLFRFCALLLIMNSDIFVYVIVIFVTVIVVVVTCARLSWSLRLRFDFMYLGFWRMAVIVAIRNIRRTQLRLTQMSMSNVSRLSVNGYSVWKHIPGYFLLWPSYGRFRLVSIYYRCKRICRGAGPTVTLILGSNADDSKLQSELVRFNVSCRFVAC